MVCQKRKGFSDADNTDQILRRMPLDLISCVLLHLRLLSSSHSPLPSLPIFIPHRLSLLHSFPHAECLGSDSQRERAE